MAVYSRPLDLYKGQVARFQKMEYDMTKIHMEIVRGGREDLYNLTAGSITTKQLRAMGHPFGRGLSSKSSTASGLMRGNRAGRRSKQFTGKRFVNPLPINKQSGQLRRGIFMHRTSGGTLSYEVGSAAPYEPYILSPSGTTKMVGRGIFGVIKQRHKTRRKAYIDVFIKKQRTS